MSDRQQDPAVSVRAPSDAGAHLVLLLTGNSPRSQRARANLRDALERVGGEAALEPMEVDLLSRPRVALDYGIYASPALLWEASGRVTAVLYGDLSDKTALLRFIGAPRGPQ